MPLLKRKQFETSAETLLRDEEEVFFCEITGEVFRDYEEFSERLFLCNSMVWTCSMTGKSNLTYQEALESEENAKRSLREFPMELRIPILFIASKTKRSSFGDMAEDVFMYTKDRYFMGENLETCLTGTKWRESHVLQVMAPEPGTVKASPPKNGYNADRIFFPPANSYKYEIENLDADNENASEISIVSHSEIRRSRTLFNREKCKLFLKQYVEVDDNGVWVVKPSFMDKFGISRMKFDQISDGPLPVFSESSKLTKKMNGNGYKPGTKQESMSKYLTKNGGTEKKPRGKGGNGLLDQMKKREEDFKAKKLKKEEEKLAKKQQKKEENLRLAMYLKEFWRPKEDLELEDQMKLPVPTAVMPKIPDKYLSDLLMILEFVHSFAKVLDTNNFFPQGLTYDVLEKAFIDKGVTGPLTDIIQMFLSALFAVQEEESNQYRTQLEKGTEVKEEDLPQNLSLDAAENLATLASGWSNRHQGLPLTKLPLYSVTVSEILRLHLLSSGARINENGARWRYQQRGGYISKDDPGLHLRLHEPHILKALSLHNVVQLATSDKIKIISCLMDQLLTYADVRDLVEEKLDKNRQNKVNYRLTQIAERKRETEFCNERAKLKKQNKNDPETLAKLVEKLEKSNECKQVDNERAMEQSMKAILDSQVYLGCDRAFRKYYKLESVSGILVHCEEAEPGVCLDSVIKQYPELQNADKNQVQTHLKNIYEEGAMNGARIPAAESCDELLMCSTDAEKCIVHSEQREKMRWGFYRTHEEVDELVNNLNKRGYRESELQQILKMDKEKLYKLVAKTPVAQLNAEVYVPSKSEEDSRQPRKKKDRYEDANLGFPADMSPEDVLHNAMTDNILEMEEKIFAGNLGALSVKNREAWRECLTNKDYTDFDRTIVRKEHHLKQKMNGKNSRPGTPDPEAKPEQKEYVDPGRFLGTSAEEAELNGSDETQSETISKGIKFCAIALAQVARGLEPKYVKKPLGKETSKKDNKKDASDCMDNWEQSLLASTSFSQVFLHYGTLDSCVMWSRSALLTRCRICRRQKDSENMLLCDNCNWGHHLYCLKPKLNSVPRGDWFCPKCKAEKQKEMKQVEQPKRKRKIFKEEEESDADEEDEEEKHDNRRQSEDEGEETEDQMKVDVCKTCGSGGELLSCEKCSLHYHTECVSPPLRRAPRGAWTCTKCKESNDRKRRREREEDDEDEEDDEEEEDSESETEENDDDEEEVVSKSNRRSARREDNRRDLPLHNVTLQELLGDVMKHKDAWPFLRPVQKVEVPDYYEVITRPMDFGTIKYKLNIGEYNEDKQLMDDAVLVFENCNSYNHSGADVYKCGVRLAKYFRKRSKELNLKVPKELMLDGDDDVPDDDNGDEEEDDEEDLQPLAKRLRTD